MILTGHYFKIKQLTSYNSFP